MWDAIVIGSGVGGMTASGLLAGVAGKKVLVLEKHSEPGGLTHVFRRDGASWDVGLHYLGELEPGSQVRAFFDCLSGGELRWNRMTDEFERFVYPGLDFRVPSDPRGRQQPNCADLRAGHREPRRLDPSVAGGHLHPLARRPGRGREGHRPAGARGAQRIPIESY